MADEDIKLKGFEKASIYRGQKIDDDYLKRVLNMTTADINKKALSEGLGIFGKDPETTKMLNQMLVEAGEKPYTTRNPILRKIEVDLFSSDLGKSKMERMVFNTRLEKISNAVQSMKGSLDDKISYIRNTVKQFYPGISKASLKELPKLFAATLGLPVSAGLSLAFSPSAEAAELPEESIKDQVMKNMDFSAPSASSQLLEKMSQDAVMKAGGGIVTFVIKGGVEKGRQFLDKLQMISMTANLGDSRTIATHPASTTHSKLSEEERQEVGILPGLIRISVGLEHIDDIVNDIEQAIK